MTITCLACRSGNVDAAVERVNLRHHLTGKRIAVFFRLYRCHDCGATEREQGDSRARRFRLLAADGTFVGGGMGEGACEDCGVDMGHVHESQRRCPRCRQRSKHDARCACRFCRASRERQSAFRRRACLRCDETFTTSPDAAGLCPSCRRTSGAVHEPGEVARFNLPRVGA